MKRRCDLANSIIYDEHKSCMTGDVDLMAAGFEPERGNALFLQ